MNLPKEALLKNEITGQSIKVNFCGFTTLKYFELVQLLSKYQNTKAISYFLKNKDVILKLKGLNIDSVEMKKAQEVIDELDSLGMTPDQLIQLVEISQDKDEIGIKYQNHLVNIQIIKTMIDRNKLLEGESEIIDSDDFWLGVLVEEVGKLSDSFREAIK